MFCLNLLDIFFTVIHTLLILFNLTGWIFKKTRRLNLIVLLITAFSWFGLGIIYGFGYCFLTDWHWTILEKLGKTDLPDTYLQMLCTRLLSLTLSASTAEVITASGFFAALIISIILNVNDFRKRRKRVV